MLSLHKWLHRAIVNRMRTSWNTLLPAMERIAGVMEEKLLIAEEAAVRSTGVLSVVAT